MTSAVIVVTHAGATMMMAGLIWFVQLVHYPIMRSVGRSEWVAWEREHVRRTTWIVAPLMLVELVTAVMLAFDARLGPARGLAWAGLGLVAVAWASTALLQVPCHRRLETAYDEGAIRRLVATNWIRTIAWSGRSAIALVLLWRYAASR